LHLKVLTTLRAVIIIKNGREFNKKVPRLILVYLVFFLIRRLLSHTITRTDRCFLHPNRPLFPSPEQTVVSFTRTNRCFFHPNKPLFPSLEQTVVSFTRTNRCFLHPNRPLFPSPEQTVVSFTRTDRCFPTPPHEHILVTFTEHI
jgi:hypothetical protein